MADQHRAMEGRQPFRFMDLPKDIRLMVYERLPRKIRHIEIGPQEPIQTRLRDLPVTRIGFLVTRSVSTSILRVSRAVYAEAKGIVAKTLRKFILEKIPKIMVFPPQNLMDEIFEAIAHQLSLVYLPMNSKTTKRAWFTPIPIYNASKIRPLNGASEKDIRRFIDQVARSLAYQRRPPFTVESVQFLGRSVSNQIVVFTQRLDIWEILNRNATSSNFLMSLDPENKAAPYVDKIGFLRQVLSSEEYGVLPYSPYQRFNAGNVPFMSLRDELEVEAMNKPVISREVWEAEWLE